jgi:hypothetical protein
MLGVAYLLSAGICLLCGTLLLRAYWRHRVRLLFWSSLCFFGLSLDNVLQYVDNVIVPDLDMRIVSLLPGLAALTLLVWGLVWESK